MCIRDRLYCAPLSRLRLLSEACCNNAMPGHRTPVDRIHNMNTTGSLTKFLIPSIVLVVIIGIVFSNHVPPSHASTQFQYKFQNPDLSLEERIDNILSLMTLDEKVECLDTNPSVPRLGIKGSGHVEGIHGLTQGGPGRWGKPKTIPTTTSVS